MLVFFSCSCSSFLIIKVDVISGNPSSLQTEADRPLYAKVNNLRCTNNLLLIYQNNPVIVTVLILLWGFDIY